MFSLWEIVVVSPPKGRLGRSPTAGGCLSPEGGVLLAEATLSRCADDSARVEDDDGGRALVTFDEGGAGACTAELEE
jgi:hypothetical protein